MEEPPGVEGVRGEEMEEQELEGAGERLTEERTAEGVLEDFPGTAEGVLEDFPEGIPEEEPAGEVKAEVMAEPVEEATEEISAEEVAEGTPYGMSRCIKSRL